MLMLIHVEQVFAESAKKSSKAPIEWALDGRAFVIRDRDVLVQTWLPMFFRYGKFQSFTRKLYRWGFRQVNLPRDNQQEKRELIFANPHFQKDKRSLMVHMKSVTAASTRREKEEKQLSESKLPDSYVEPPMAGLMGLGTPRFLDSLLMNQAQQHLAQPRPVALPSLSGNPLLGQTLAQTALDPVVRQLLLSQQNRDFGGLLVDLHRQQQASQQLRLPSVSSFNLHGQEPLGLPQNFSIAPPPAPRHPFENLMEARSSTPTASAASSSTNIETINRERLLQERLRELAEQFLRGNTSAGPSSPRPLWIHCSIIYFFSLEGYWQRHGNQSSLLQSRMKQDIICTCNLSFFAILSSQDRELGQRRGLSFGPVHFSLTGSAIHRGQQESCQRGNFIQVGQGGWRGSAHLILHCLLTPPRRETTGVLPKSNFLDWCIGTTNGREPVGRGDGVTSCLVCVGAGALLVPRTKLSRFVIRIFTIVQPNFQLWEKRRYSLYDPISSIWTSTSSVWKKRFCENLCNAWIFHAFMQECQKQKTGTFVISF